MTNSEILIGAIDAGSNAIRFTIFKLLPGQPPIALLQKRFPVRLGAGTFETGNLAETDIEKAIIAFNEINSIAEDKRLTAISAVATSAIRDAANCQAFLQRVKTETGISLKTITGEDEARLAVLGAASSNGPIQNGLLIDVGGGSTEIASFDENANISSAISLPLGAVRLSQMWGNKGIYSAAELNSHSKQITEQLQNMLSESNIPPKQAVGVGGTAKALLNMCNATIPGTPSDNLSFSDLEQIAMKLSKTPTNEIPLHFEIDQERSTIILAGALITLNVMKHFQLSDIIITEAGVREGLAREYQKQLGWIVS